MRFRSSDRFPGLANDKTRPRRYQNSETGL